MRNLILTDCDGVLVDWHYHFPHFMRDVGYDLPTEYPHGEFFSYRSEYYRQIPPDIFENFVRAYCLSSYIKHCPPYKDSIKYVKKLHEEHGYVFGVITSLSDNQYAREARKENLEKLFGPSAIEFLTCLPTGFDKRSELQKFAGEEYFWIEDHPENANYGHIKKLNSILMNHTHNEKADLWPDIPRVDNWKQIYDIIIGN